MIYAFWYKTFKSLTSTLRDLIWDAIDGSEEIPEWLVEGRTVMFEKEGCTGRPEEYRPITCLNIAYKTMTGALTGILMNYVEQANLLPEEQKALRKGARGESDQGYTCADDRPGGDRRREKVEAEPPHRLDRLQKSL